MLIFDKDDLFAKDVEDFFEHMANAVAHYDASSQRVAPVREFLRMWRRCGSFERRWSLQESGVWSTGLGVNAWRRIERRLSQIPRGQLLASRARGAVSHALAGALFSLLEWWLANGNGATPEQMDALSQRMVCQG